MKFKVNRVGFTKIVGLVSGVAGLRQINPVLKNVAIVTEGKRIKVFATDLSRFLEMSIEATIVEEGSILLEASTLATFLNFLESEEVEVSGDTKIKVEGGKYKVNFQTSDFSDFPELPKPKGETFDTDLNFLNELSSRVAISCGDQTQKIFMQSIYFDLVKKCVSATDSQRASILKMGITGNGTYLFPFNVTPLLKNLTSDGNLKVTFSTGWITFQGDLGRVGVMGVSENFPDIQASLDRIIVGEPATKLELSKSELKKVLGICDYFISQNKVVTSVQMVWGKGKAQFKVVIADLADVDNSVECDIEGEQSGIIQFRPKLMLDGCNAVRSNKVTLKVWEPFKPILVEDNECPEWVYTVMPTGDSNVVEQWKKAKEDSVVEESDF